MNKLRKRRGSRYYGRGHTKDLHKGGHGFAGSKTHNRLWVYKHRDARAHIKKVRRDPMARVLLDWCSNPSVLMRKRVFTFVDGVLTVNECKFRQLMGVNRVNELNQALEDGRNWWVFNGSKSKLLRTDLVSTLTAAGVARVVINGR